MKEDLSNQTVLITGGAKRTGRQIALSLSGAGMNAVIHYRSSEKEAEELQAQLRNMGVQSWTIQREFNAETDFSKFLADLISKAGSLECLINNASIFPPGDVEEIKFDDLIENIEVNSWAPFSLTRTFVDTFESGKVVNLLDARVEGYDWTHTGYYFSKVLLTRMTKMMALKYAPNFRINGVAPGLITPPPGGKKEYLKKRVNRVPLARHGEKTDVADTVKFLLESSFITGEVVHVDGGRNLLHELLG